MSKPKEDAEERLSCEFDTGNISQTSLEQLGRAFVESTTDSWIDIGDAMRRIPVEPAWLHQNVMRELTAVQPEMGSNSSVFPSMRRTTLLASITAACALLVTGVLLTRVNESPSKGSLAVTANLPQLFDGVRNTNHNDWEVVVVTVPVEDHARIRDRITASVVDQGLAVDSVNSGDQVVSEHSPDVLISTGDTSLEVLRAVESEIQQSAGDLTTEQTAEFDRDELLSRFRESMASPTESDRYFGEMLVIHADSNSVTLTAEPIGEAVADSRATLVQPSSSSGNPMSTTNGPSGVSGTNSERKRPVLVVLVKKKEAVPGPQSERSESPTPQIRTLTLITG